eukprot:8076533-Alexandrium_andersonii.AAC.1
MDWVLRAVGLGEHAGPATFAMRVDLSHGPGRCPLCGTGEQTSEHLVLRCPAVAMALCAHAYGS